MEYLFDTNVCIGLMRGRASHLTARVDALELSGEAAVLSSIVLSELWVGAERSVHRVRNLSAVMGLTERFIVVGYDAPAAQVYGRVRAELARQGTPIGPLDTLIAAHALSLDLTLITANVREFSRVPGLRVKDWETL